MEFEHNTSLSQKLFVISDIHLGIRNNNLSWQDNIKSYFYKFFFPLVKSKMDSQSSVLILGDIFDDRKSISIDTLNLALDILKDLAEIMPVTVIVGNHDMFKKYNNEINSLKIFENFSNITVVSKPSVADDGRVLLLPYQANVDEENKIVNEYLKEFESQDKTKPNLIFTHNDIAGLTYDNGKSIATGLSIKRGSNVRIYSGHIHKRQETKRVVYIGSPYQLKRSDLGNQKGVYLIDLKKPESFKFFENNFSPVFVREYFETLKDLTVGEIKKKIKNCYADVIVSEKDLKTFNVNDLFDILQSTEAKRIQIIENKDIDLNGLLDKGLENYKELTLDEIVESNISSMNIEDEEKKSISDLYSYYRNIVKEDSQNE